MLGHKKPDPVRGRAVNSMFEDAVSEFHDIVIPSINEYIMTKALPYSGRGVHLRSGLSAAGHLYHFFNHFMNVDKTLDFKYFNGLCPDFKRLSNVVNAGKHVLISHGKNHAITEKKQIRETRVTSIFYDKEGKYTHTDIRLLMIEDKANLDGPDIFGVMVNVANMWIDFLSDKQLIEKERCPYYRYTADQFRFRSQCVPAETVEAWATVGVKFDLLFKTQVYDPQTNTMLNPDDQRVSSFNHQQPFKFRIWP